MIRKVVPFVLCSVVSSCGSDEESQSIQQTYPLDRNDPRSKLPRELIGIQPMPISQNPKNKEKLPNKYSSTRRSLSDAEISYAILEPNSDKQVQTDGNNGKVFDENDPLSTQSSAIIIGNDSRQPVPIPNNLLLPYRGIVKIFSQFPQASSGCTGTLVGPRLVATAGHCIYKESKGGWITGARVVPALDYDYMPFGDAAAVQAEVETNWVEDDEDQDHDFGLLTLERPLGDLVGWLGTTTLENPYVPFSLNGYPGDLPAPFPDPRSSLMLYGDSDSPIDDSDDLLYYETDTAEGQSGSGLTRFLGERGWFTIGTHHGKCYHIWSLDYVNCSVRYTSSRVNMVSQANASANNFPVAGMTNGSPWTDWNGWTQIPPTVVPYGFSNWTQIFVVGGDQRVFTKTHSPPSSVGGWYLRDGVTTATPVAAIKRSGANADAFVRSLSGSVSYLPNAASNSSTWQNLGGNIVDSPSVVEMVSGRVDVFGVGPNRRVYQNVVFGSSGNTTWYDLGGGAASNVVAISKAPNTMDLFVLGYDSAVWTKTWNGSSWLPSATTWTRISNSGLFSGQIAAVSWGQNRIDLFGPAQSSISSSAVWHMAWSSSGGWEAPESLGGVVVGSVTAVSQGANNLEVFVRSPSGLIFQKTWSGGPTWLPSNNSWTPLGGDMMESPSVSVVGNTVDVVARGKEGHLWNRWWNGSSWQ